jgi:HEAT repeat protein
LALIDSREIPHSFERGPDLSYYTESAQYYFDLICESAPHLKDKPRAVTDAERELASIANNRIVNASWGLIARGVDAVPFAIRLITSKDRDLRESGANVFAGFRDPSRLNTIVDRIMSALEVEQDRLVIDTLVGALGNLRSRQAVPFLRRLIADPHKDADTRWEAAVSLGKITGKRFDKKGADAIELAQRWLTKNA